MSDRVEPGVQDAPPRRRGRFRRAVTRLLVVLVLPGSVIAGAAYYYVVGGRIVTTENAYIKSDKIAVSTDIPGRAVKVLVGENDHVSLGQVLFQLDEEPFRIEFVRADAGLAKAIQEVDALRAVYRQKMAEMEIARGDIDYYRRDFDRQKQLKARGIVSVAKYDKVNRNLLAARQHVVAIRQDIAQVLANLGGDLDLAPEDHPTVRGAMAARDEAELDLRRTVIRAPVAGIVTNLNLEAGEFVKAGTPIFSLIGTDDAWIEANLKETDLTYVRVGQAATARIDAYPDREWQATVTSISPATGAEFALLPPQNSSSNWVKAVQRVAVRFEIKRTSVDPPLRAGMSVIVDIDTGHERDLPNLVATALAWVKGEQ